jgi:serine/threonine protein kinase
MIGRVVGNYRVVEKIGEGGMGAVYRAVDLMLERDVALKAIRPELAREPQIVERFRAEARTLARISHPAIANVYAFFYQEDELFLALEYVRGQTLSRVLQTGAIPWQRAVQLLATAMEGIEQAHRTGIVHRDLKPDNLMLTEAGTLKVMDFGIARVMGSGHLTRTGLLVGTLRYMSPEQIRGEEVDGRTDVYALGAVLYEMLTGRTPFEGTSDWAILRAQIEEIPRPPGEQVPFLPWWLDRAVLRALAKQPAERFQSVEEMRLCLLRQGETQPSGRPQDGPPSLADLPTRVTPASAARSALLSPPGGHTTAASPPPIPPPPPAAAPPVPPVSTSYRPVELGRQGAAGRKTVILAAAAVFFLGLVLAGLWLLSSFLSTARPAAENKSAAASVPQSAAPAAPEVRPVSSIATIATAPQPTPALSVETPPVPAPVKPRLAPPLPRPVPRKPEPVPTPEAGSSQAATTTPPQTPEEPAPDSESSAAEPPVPTGQAAFEELHRLAAELDTKSGDLVDRYKEFLSKKENGGAQLTKNDEQLKDDLEAFQDAAVTLDKQFQVGRWGRMFGHKADDRRKTNQNFRRLAGLGAQIHQLLNEVRPGREVRQAWVEVRRRWKRVGSIVAGLKEGS